MIPSDSQEHAAAVREVDLQNKFPLSPTELAKKLNLNINDSKALRDYLDVDKDPALCHVFTFGSQKHSRFSENAVKKNEGINTRTPKCEESQATDQKEIAPS